ncbi:MULTISPECIES: EamA family transporter [unclassified Caballeronia]|uniref:EamA family transporter n=1 Tax=unclassified Caballeronia TaxID=2646786 RepID=UPI0028650A79|nr:MULTISPECIES: EamA family transporter [unclassified Caballeronia]MDR5750107.1 EamA family transporter [Caballeronia sp. LZ024]MDR5842765.1 EamA family transporter [Caballeronia sp. LZ031]
MPVTQQPQQPQPPKLPSSLPFNLLDRFPFRLPRTQQGRVALALAVVYIVWGSTYMAVHLSLASFPPLMLSGLRNLFAGIGLFIFAARKKPIWPTGAEIRNAAIVGTLLVGLSSGMLAFGMRTVETGTAAVMVATVPLFATVIAALTGRKIAKGEWVAVGLGLVGIALLNHGDTSSGSTAGSLAILCGAVFWAGGAHLAGKLKLPSDLFVSTALQIGLGGTISTIVAWLSGERIASIGFVPFASFLYLMLIGTMAAYVAYGYLIRHTSPIIASSCMYVNPVVAVALGSLLLGEVITRWTVIATVVILISVGLSFWFDYRRRGLV